MTVDFVRFKASDGVELRGWLTDTGTDMAVIHIHGMSGNGYENSFLDNLREVFERKGISMFAIDTRGSGVINSFWTEGEGDAWGEGTKPGGSCYEIFEESEHDIHGAIDYLKTRGKKKFILMGHSLGGSKVVNYLAGKERPEMIGAILLAPTDMAGWVSLDPKHEGYLKKAKELIAEGKGTSLVDVGCWIDETPISAQTYPTICEAGRAVDIYGVGGKATLGQVDIPMLVVYGDEDIGITKIDGAMDKWTERVERIKDRNTRIEVIKGASHSFRGYEKEMAERVEKFVKPLV